LPLVTARRTGLVDQVIEQLRAAVASGEWAIGQRIPNETALVESLGVGRNTVREAVRALAHAGILEVRQGDGTYVRATSEVSGALRRLCCTEWRDVLQVRRAREVEGARGAALRRTDEDLAERRDVLARRDAALAGTTDDFARADAEFHLAVMRCSHNATLIELYRGLMEAITASVATSYEATMHAVDHSALLEHIAAGDVEQAGRAAAAIIDSVLGDLLC
jgi:DNA-binding FadR family transcriptional regulator